MNYHSFQITSVCRADIAQALVDCGKSEQEAERIADAISDEDMTSLASKMADAYCENGFWIDLPILAENVCGIKF